MRKTLEAYIGKEDEGMTVRGYLRKRFGLTDREIGRAKFREDGILLNGRTAYANAPLLAGDLLQVNLGQAGGGRGGGRLAPVEGALAILYEDEDLLAIDKPAGLVSHPSGVHVEDTAANRMAWHLLQETGEEVPIRLAGRLDKETSGVLLAAKSRAAAASLARQRREGRLRKTYLALVQGHMEEKEGEICRPILQDPDFPLRVQISERGKYAKTWYRVLEEREGSSLLECRIETGRMHQIRAHLSCLGHPLVGDALYGSACSSGRGFGCGQDRLCLHAWKLAFRHPFTGEPLELCAHLESRFRSS